VNTVWIGRISVRDECDFLLRVSGSGGFTHGDDSILSVARVSDVVGSDFKAL
jgi:hypothetical protein